MNEPLKPGELAYQPLSCWAWALKDDGLCGERVPWDSNIIFMIVSVHKFDTNWFVCLAGERLVICHPTSLKRLDAKA